MKLILNKDPMDGNTVFLKLMPTVEAVVQTEGKPVLIEWESLTVDPDRSIKLSVYPVPAIDDGYRFMKPAPALRLEPRAEPRTLRFVEAGNWKITFTEIDD